MKRLLTLVAAIAVACTSIVSSALADTSYFLLQGPFGAGNLTETYKWKFVYEPGELTNGGDLLEMIFGKPVDNGGDEWIASKGGVSVGYKNFEGTLMIRSFTVNGITVETPIDWSSSWHYNVAGGAGDWSVTDENPDGIYDSGLWFYPDDTFNTRYLADGSFDAWTFGIGDVDDLWRYYVDGVLPLEVYFADATVVMIPEPGSLALGLAGATGLWLVRRRKKVASV